MNKKGQTGPVIRSIIIALFSFLISEGFNEAFKQLVKPDSSLILKAAILITTLPIDLIIILAILVWYICDLLNN